ncbi:MAG: CheW domain-containing protein [Myxococcota bacterium]
MRVRAWRVALPVADVVEQMRPLPVEQVRGTPAYVLGMSRVRGAPMPVMDLGRFLAGTPGPVPESLTARWVTVRAGERRIALAVDAVEGVRTVDAEHLGTLAPLLRDADTAAVAALGVLDASLLVLLHAARLLDAGAVPALDGE